MWMYHFKDGEEEGLSCFNCLKEDGPDPIMREYGRLGGLKGGPGRAKSLSLDRRKEIASKAAKARWQKSILPNDQKS